MDETTKKILEIVTDIQSELAGFRKEFRTFRDETNVNFREIRAEVADLRRDMEALKDKVENMVGYAKEIDMLMARVSALERKIGIAKQD